MTEGQRANWEVAKREIIEREVVVKARAQETVEVIAGATIGTEVLTRLLVRTGLSEPLHLSNDFP